MPIFEEKLVSPLALRFTQEHIKTIFRDGRIVEDTVSEIKTQPSTTDDYDLVLQAPFPLIEIIRWGRDEGEGLGRHWFTLDNRRLYCLQRAAMQHWPLRVAAKVEILYADPGAVKRKYDSTTLGESVTVAHSCKDAALFRWDWRTEVRELEDASPEERRPWNAIARDDERHDVDELQDVKESALDRLVAFEQALGAAATAAAAAGDGDCGRRRCLAQCATASTSATSDDSDGTPRSVHRKGTSKQAPRQSSTREEGLAVWALEEINWQLRAPSADGRLRIKNWSERYGWQLGSLRKFIEARPHLYTLISEPGGKFRLLEVASSDGEGSTAEVAKRAAEEIKAQLQAHGGVGHVQIDDWSGRYAGALGPFKAFVRSRTGDFTIVPGSGKYLKVALV